MKKIGKYLVLILVAVVIYQKRDDIYSFYIHVFNNESYAISTLEKNKYFRNYDFKYVQNTEKYVPESKQDILNIYYTVVNSGTEKFTFHCSDKYTTCLNDIEALANNQTTISNINNFVHPFNSFNTIETTIDSRGNITLNVDRIYNNEMIILLNYKIDEIYKEVFDGEKTLQENIKLFHDYIINNTQYDKERADSKIVKYKSDNAYGPLIEGYALCGGYTDAMMLFLEKLDVKSYKISTNNHTWNRLFINNSWLHLDLTWDDPISEDGKNVLDDSYFLINTNELLSIEKTEHNYDYNIYEN